MARAGNHAAGRAARSGCRVPAVSPLRGCGRSCHLLRGAGTHHRLLRRPWHLYRHFRPHSFSGEKPTRRWAIAALMFPIAAEVGFASSGAGAMGTLVLMGLSSLEAAKVVGTDLAFAFCMTLTGSGLHLASGFFDSALLIRLIAGGESGGDRPGRGSRRACPAAASAGAFGRPGATGNELLLPGRDDARWQGTGRQDRISSPCGIRQDSDFWASATVPFILKNFQGRQRSGRSKQRSFRRKIAEFPVIPCGFPTSQNRDVGHPKLIQTR